MAKLAQSYSWSATQLNALERPKLPPPPKAFVPTDVQSIDGAASNASKSVASSGASSTGTVHTAGSSSGEGGSAVVSPAGHVSNTPAVQPPISGETLSPVRTGIDSVGTLPAQTPAETPRMPVDSGPARGAVPHSGPVPPLFGGGQVLPVNSSTLPQGRTPGVGRVPMPPVGQGPGTVFGRSPGVSGGGNGIVGGRPVLPSEGRPTGAIPRGTVVGGENMPVRGPMGQTTSGMTNPVGRTTGTPLGSRPVSPSGSGGIVGGRPASNTGVVGGGSTQQQRRSGVRVPGSGAVGSGGSGTGTRNAITGGATAAGRSNEGHGAGGTVSRPSQAAPSAQTRSGSGRPYGVTEDEETWRRNHRPTVPPVVD